MPEPSPFTNPPDTDTEVFTLCAGVRLVALRLPHLATTSAAVFLRSGSAHESRALNGISHFAEHMVFKGTVHRDAHRINLDAERLGAEVNAHTDKDHSALHMRGRAGHETHFVPMLAEILLQPSFPPDELERERQVLLQEHAEVEDDPAADAFRLFDRACFGEHPAAQTVIGPRRHIEAFKREDLLGWMTRQVTAPNIVVGVAGPLDPGALAQRVETAFAAAPAGQPNRVAPVVYGGGIATRRHPGSGQAQLVLGFPIPALAQESPAHTMAAALFGDGMSSPLMQGVRERRALAYYAACSADVLDVCGQFVVEAACTPEPLAELLDTVLALLRRQADGIDAVDLERARNQLGVRLLRAHEKPLRRLETAALDLFALGRVRPLAERLQALQAVTAAQVQQAFAQMLQAGATVAVAGHVPRGTRAIVRERLLRHGAGGPALN